MREILREVGMITRCFESIANIEFKDYNLSKNQYIYLVRICENPGIIQERVADILKVDRSTASRAIEKLKQAGFIEKVINEGNKKNVRLYASEKGLEIHKLLQREEECSDETALSGLSQDELKTLLMLLSKIRKNIEPDWELVKSGGKRSYLNEIEIRK
ncbi:MAG TPA: MarR family transcriptional regulator [Anaerovoracaceae bacterium]|nr:MarR family transcriptional regulator [Anaerovoracaceae bacterium]